MKTNIKEKAISRIVDQLEFLKKNKDRITIDADTHITDIKNLNPEFKSRLESDNYYHGKPISAEDLVKEMDMAGVDMALVWQNPSSTQYSEDSEKNFESLYNANKYIYESSVNMPHRLIPAGWTDPRALGEELAIKLVDICVFEFGFGIVKLNPAQNAFPIDSDIVKKMVDRIVQNGAVPAFHFGADTEFTPAEGLAIIAERIAPESLIAVHMGGGGASYTGAETLYNQARQLGLEKPNIRYVLSAKRDTHIESDLITYTLAGKPYIDNLFCASDAPYGRMTWNFGGYRQMFKSLINGAAHTDIRLKENPNLFTEEITQKFLGGNMAEFAININSRMLENIIRRK